MEWWRWNTCIKALKNDKYQPKEGGEKKEETKKHSNLKKYRPKEGEKKKSYKKQNFFDRPTLVLAPKG